MNKQHHISWNIQFAIVSDGVICFSVSFAIIHGSVRIVFSDLFFRNQKGNVVVVSALSFTKPCLSFLKFQFLAKILVKKAHCPWNQPHFLRNSDKSLLSPEQNKLKEIWHMIS